MKNSKDLGGKFSHFAKALKNHVQYINTCNLIFDAICSIFHKLRNINVLLNVFVIAINKKVI